MEEECGHKVTGAGKIRNRSEETKDFAKIGY